MMNIYKDTSLARWTEFRINGRGPRLKVSATAIEITWLGYNKQGGYAKMRTVRLPSFGWLFSLTRPQVVN